MAAFFRTEQDQIPAPIINLQKPVQFRFDGKTYSGFEGDTLASALLAGGVCLLGRSFKYHRPRGIIAAGSEEPNALVELREGARREPNMRATMVELYDGLIANSQNRWPSLRADILSLNQLIAPFLFAGFYYKTFMWPASFWEPVYEKFIRRSAGLGRAALEPDPDIYEHANKHCEVLIVGGGVCGLAAAFSAAATGARVILAEENFYYGGTCSPSYDLIDGLPAEKWIEHAIARLGAMDNVVLMPRMTVFGYYDHNVCGALERVSDHLAEPQPDRPRQRLWTIRARQIVLATGSHERPLSFANNDLPGIMLAGAVRHYYERFGVVPGKKAVIATNNDSAYTLAEMLHHAGVEVPVIADARMEITAAMKQARELNIKIELGTRPKKAYRPRFGTPHIQAIELMRADGTTLKADCDVLALSGGFTPNINLASQKGFPPIWKEDLQAFIAGQSNEARLIAGAAQGVYSLDQCLISGHKAGLEAASAAGFTPPRNHKLTAPKAAGQPQYKAMPTAFSPAGGKAFIDFQNDVTETDIRIAAREGYHKAEHAKRYTTLGMATDQGKIAHISGSAVLADETGKAIEQIGITRHRAPYTPVAIGALAGHKRQRDYAPIRRTAMHHCHEKLGATFIEAGHWLRPQIYPKPGETMMEAIYRETRQVRQTVGMCDVSTLGKIEIFGKDAAEFLNLLYTNGWSKLPVGKARYGIMLREDGHVFDDGTTSRLGENHFFMTTTTANASAVVAHMEYASQVLWPKMDVHFTSATEQWCGVAIAGPNARKMLQAAFGKAIDLSNDALPFMGVADFVWNGARARIFRISFSGELAYEINMPWRYGEAMWDAFFEVGKAHGLIPYGLEALSSLRIEKGHVVANELDGRTTADDLGLGGMVSSKKHFIGEHLAKREGMVEAARPRLVGFKMTGAKRGLRGEKLKGDQLRGGAHLVNDPADASTSTSLGWLSSVTHSPQIGAWIGLGFMKGGPERIGEKVFAIYPMAGEVVEVEICHPVFFDPQGERLRG